MAPAPRMSIPAGKLFQHEGVGGGKDDLPVKRKARNLAGSGAARQNRVSAGYLLPSFHYDAIGRPKRGAALYIIHLILLEQKLDALGEPLGGRPGFSEDLAVIEAGEIDGGSHLSQGGCFGVYMRLVDQGLRGNTTYIEADAPRSIFFQDDRREPKLTRPYRGYVSAGTRSDYRHIVRLFRHVATSLRNISSPMIDTVSVTLQAIFLFHY